jgi:hypothetical protein
MRIRIQHVNRVEYVRAKYPKVRDPMVLAHLAGQECGRQDAWTWAFSLGALVGAALTHLGWWFAR